MTLRPFVIAGLFWGLCGCDSTTDGPSTGDAGDAGQTAQPSEEPDGGDASCINTMGTQRVAPLFLSETGLYSDIADKTLHEAVKGFRPLYELWSDGAAKERFIYLPECGVIDSSDMNDWSFPVGTRFYKEFSVDGRRIETRLVMRTGPDRHDFVYASYLWNEDETEAERAPPEGIMGAKGTAHHIPSEANCRRCHGSHEKRGGRPSRGLGFSAMQLNHDGEGWTLDDLIEDGKLSQPPTVTIGFPGEGATQDALGYLHVNCGTCHNDSEDGLPQTDMNLWLDIGITQVENSSIYQTAVGQKNKIFNDQHVTARVEPGDPASSAVIYRMGQRGNNAQMPPIASDRVDHDGIEAVSAWIESLP